MAEEKKEQKKFLKFESATEERLIVGFLYRDRATFLKLAQYLVTPNWRELSYFIDPKLQFIVNTCYRFSERFKRPIDKNTLYTFIEKGMDTVLQAQTKKLLGELEEIDYSKVSADFLREQAVAFIKKERAIEATYKCSSMITDGKFDDLDKTMREAVNINLDKDLGISIRDTQKVLEMIQEVQDPDEGCTWGSPTIDERSGRLLPGELGVIAGVPGAGKTLWLGHFALSNMKEGKKVIMFSFEVNQKRLAARLYKNLFKINTKELLDADPEKISAEMAESDGDLRIVCRTANSTSANRMAAVLNDLKTYEGWEPDLIIVDYIAITATNNSRASSSDNSYKYYKTVAEELRNLGVEFNCPVISASQINREAMGDKGGSKAVVTSKNIAESRGVLDTADALFIIEQTDKEKAEEKDNDGRAMKGSYRIRVDKSRNSDSGYTVPFLVDWRTLSISEKPKEARK